MRFWLALRVLTFCMLSAAAGAKAAYPFSVTTEVSGGGHQVLAHNAGPATVSVRLTVDKAENIAAVQALPVYAVVQPYSDLRLLQIRPLTPGRSSRFATQATYKLGSIHAVPDPRALYRLPYENGRRFVIGQAAGGPMTTHDGEDSRYAVDFTMPRNTLVVAARDGVVIETESSYRLGGPDPALLSKANHVSIQHADGTVAFYVHLAPGGVRVRPGERVLAGTPIGYSGATGFASAPHLHFVVQKLVRENEGFASVSIPVRFYVGVPPRVFEPRYQQWITADYASPGKASARGK